MRRRLQALRSAEKMSYLPSTGRPHPLRGDRKGQFAYEVGGGLRLIFEPDHDPAPCLQDGGIDLANVSRVKIWK